MNRSTFILFLLLIALGAIAYFVLPSSEERESSDKAPVVSFSVDSASVVKIVLVRGPKSMTLENVGGKWMITAPANYSADAMSVLQILQGLSRFKLGSLISSNPEKQKLFQVDSSGTEITVTDRAGKSASIIIGKMGPSFSEVYCRIPGQRNVFLGEGLDGWTVSKELKEWRDKLITAIPTESVKGVMYTLNNREYDYVRDSTSWKLGETTVESGAMNPPLSTLSNLRADDFVDTVMRFPTQPISITVKGGTNVSLQLFPSLPDSARYYVQSSNSQQIYVISKYAAQQLLKPIDHSRPAQRSPFAKKEETTQPPSASKTTKVQQLSPQGTEKKTTQQVPQKETGLSEQTTKPKPPEQRGQAVKQAGTQPLIQEKQPSQKAPSPELSTGKKAPAGKSSTPVTQQHKAGEPRVTEKTSEQSTTAPITEKGKQTSGGTADDEGELTVYTVKAGDTMPLIAKKYGCSVEQILKWNLLKSINVKPGQELYIYVKK